MLQMIIYGMLVLSNAEQVREKEAMEFLNSKWEVTDESFLEYDENGNHIKPQFVKRIYVSRGHDRYPDGRDRVHPIDQEFLDALQNLSRLESIDWSNKVFFAEGLRISLDSWPCLQEINFAKDLAKYTLESVFDMFCQEISHSKSLRELTIEIQNTTHLTAILQAENLENLRLHYCGEWSVEATLGAKKLRELNLRHFSPTCGVLTDESLIAISHLSALEKLVIDLKDDHQLELLLPLKDTLKYLRIRGDGITSDAAKTISQCTKLKSLDISNTSVDDRFIEAIHEMPLLCLVLINTNVTDECVKYFQNWDSIREVVFPPVNFPPFKSLMTEKGGKFLDSIPNKRMWWNGVPMLGW